MFNMTWLTRCLRFLWSHSCRNKSWSNPKLIFIFEEWLLCIYSLSVTIEVSLTGFSVLLFIFPLIVKIKTNEKNGNVVENMRRMCVKWQHLLNQKVPPLQCSHCQISIMTTCTWNEDMFCQDKQKKHSKSFMSSFWSQVSLVKLHNVGVRLERWVSRWHTGSWHHSVVMFSTSTIAVNVFMATWNMAGFFSSSRRWSRKLDFFWGGLKSLRKCDC